MFFLYRPVQLCLSYWRWSLQNIREQASHFIGRKSSWRQDFSLQCFPRSGNSILSQTTVDYYLTRYISETKWMFIVFIEMVVEIKEMKFLSTHSILDYRTPLVLASLNIHFKQERLFSIVLAGVCLKLPVTVYVTLTWCQNRLRSLSVCCCLYYIQLTHSLDAWTGFAKMLLF